VPALKAIDDEFVLAPGLHRLHVLDNDVGPDGVEISVVDSTLANEVTIDGGVVTVEIAEDQVGDVEFTYLISASDATASANVRIGVVHLGTKSIRASRPSSSVGDQADARTNGERLEREAIDLDLGVPPALTALSDLRLPWQQFAGMLLACSLAVLILGRRNKRSHFVAVDNVSRFETVPSSSDGSEFHLRHDAEGIWKTGRRRGDLIEIQTPNQLMWVKDSNVSRDE